MRYKLELEFNCEENLELITSSIKDHIESAIPNYCILGCIVDPDSINITTEGETVTLSKEEYEELVRCSNYVFNWGTRITTCKKFKPESLYLCKLWL